MANDKQMQPTQKIARLIWAQPATLEEAARKAAAEQAAAQKNDF